MVNEDLIYRAVGNRVKQLREKKGFTQEALAGVIKVTRASMANYESGRQAVYLSDLYKIAEALEVELMEILPSVQEMRASSAPEELIEKASDLANDQKRELKDFLTRSAEE